MSRPPGMQPCSLLQTSRLALLRAGQRGLVAHVPMHVSCLLSGLLLCAVQYEYLWADGVKYKKPVRLSAPEYVDKLFDWVEAQVGRGKQAGWLIHVCWPREQTHQQQRLPLKPGAAGRW